MGGAPRVSEESTLAGLLCYSTLPLPCTHILDHLCLALSLTPTCSLSE